MNQPPVAEARLPAGVGLGAVFLGAMPSRGNGPNVVVKAIAAQAGVRMPRRLGSLARGFCVPQPVSTLMSPLVLDMPLAFVPMSRFRQPCPRRLGS